MKYLPLNTTYDQLEKALEYLPFLEATEDNRCVITNMRIEVDPQDEQFAVASVCFATREKV